MVKKITPELSCSVISGNPMTLAEDIKLLEQGGIDSYHFDVMDGVFVPRLGLYPEYLKMLSKLTRLPIEVHMMLEDPEPYLADFANAGASRIIPHLEPLRHPIRTLMKIEDFGVKAGIALNPGTQLSVIEPLIDHIDSVMLMSINPGILGHKLIGNIFQRLSILREMIGPDKDIKIIIDGGVTPLNANELIHAGANSLVCGGGTVFKEQERILENTSSLRKLVDSS